MVCTLSVFAQEGLRKSSEYENYMFIFEKMAENESLTYQNVNFKLENGSFVDKISALNNRTKRERLIGYWNVNMLQFSYDRKKLIFTIEGPGRFESLFLLDGGAGTVTYLFDVPGSAMTSRDLRYLMFSDAPPHDERGEPFVLIDVFEKKMIRTIYWKIAPLDGGGRRIFRSTNPEYDFRIDCEVERTLYATSYYKIATDVLCVTLDLTNSPVESDIEREAVKPEEIGR
jgi:hypothetical protein